MPCKKGRERLRTILDLIDLAPHQTSHKGEHGTWSTTVEAGSERVLQQLAQWESERATRLSGKMVPGLGGGAVCSRRPAPPVGARLARHLVVEGRTPPRKLPQQFQVYVVDGAVGATPLKRWHRELQKCPFIQSEFDSAQALAASSANLANWAVDFSIGALMTEDRTRVAARLFACRPHGRGFPRLANLTPALPARQPPPHLRESFRRRIEPTH